MSSQINTPSPHGLLKSLKRGKDVVAGTCGGIVVTLIGHPFDTLKVRLQAQSIANPVYNGVVDCFKQTVSKEGLKGLYKGMSSPLAGQMAFRATLFTSFSQSKLFLANQQNGGGLSQAQFFLALFEILKLDKATTTITSNLDAIIASLSDIQKGVNESYEATTLMPLLLDMNEQTKYIEGNLSITVDAMINSPVLAGGLVGRR